MNGWGVWQIRAVPSWTSIATGQTRVWVTNGVAGCGSTDTWAVHMRVPTSSPVIPGVTLGNDFRMFYEVRMFLPDNTLLTTPYKFPTGAPSVTPLVSGAQNFNNSDAGGDWGDVHLSTGVSDPACAGALGVSLDRYDVGTLNNYPGTTTPAPDLILYRTFNPRPINTFFVRPLNNVGAAIPAQKIIARTRVANWGSVAASGPWLDIPGGVGANATHLLPIPNSAKGEINFNWALTDADILTFATGPAASDKCILVELSSASGPGDPPVVFLNDSVYRNMTFALASKYTKEAEINIKGLSTTAAIGPKRDVYLYVQTLNMPADIPKRPTTRQPQSPTAIAAAASSGKIDSEELDKLLPTYRVFVYHDTGQRMTIDGVTYPVLEPQPSFGYHMIHEGDIEGWKHSLQGAQQIAPNFYKIPVTNDGSAKVVTTIEAVEPGVIVNPPGFKRFGLSLHAGLSIPHGDFNTFFNPGPNFGFDLEYRITPTFSLEGIYGFHHFNGDTFGPFTLSDVNVHQFSANGKVYGGTGPVRPFFNFGGGAYVFTPGANTHGGLNVGGGAEFEVNPNFAVDVMYNFHNVFTSGSSTQFSTAQGGVRFRF